MTALDALARLLVEDPKPEHHVLGWFDTAVALRLSNAGITTIGKLVDIISAVGYRWYRNVPRLGETGARRVSAWLDNTAASTASGSRRRRRLTHRTAADPCHVSYASPSPASCRWSTS
jgi:Phage integrase protein